MEENLDFSYMLLKTRVVGGDLKEVIESISGEIVEFGTNVSKQRLTKTNIKYKSGTELSCFLHPDYPDYVYVRDRDAIFHIKTGMMVNNSLSMKIPLRFISIEKTQTKTQEFVGVDRFVADIFLSRKDVSLQAELDKKKIYIDHKLSHLCCDPGNLEIRVATGKEITALKNRWNRFKLDHGRLFNTKIQVTIDNVVMPHIYTALGLSHRLAVPVEHIHYVVETKYRLHKFSFEKGKYVDCYLSYYDKA